MWGPRYGHYGYGRRRYDYDYWWHAPRAFFTVIPLLQAAQEHLTTAATPVTLALLVLQLALHYRGVFLPGLHAALPHLALNVACINPASWRQLQRLVLAPLLHVDDTHLFYNMLSLISKGEALEPQLRPARFARLVAGLALAAGCIQIALAFVLRALNPAFGDSVRGRSRRCGALSSRASKACFAPAKV
jgi:membrane associated rhomboid family serine protease